ncbi:MAG TPA: UbiD family decarboxylase domain-containing protein, partial [Trueperaceae bacterium]|nr:UbiD family decarboxylase domain-containing protein [Trueperaceae bacterium]
MSSDLREFIARLERLGELRRIPQLVSPYLEASEIADRAVKQGGPAILFENVAGHGMPVVMNLFGTRRRMALALGVDDLNDVGDRLRALIDVKLGGGLIGLMSNLPKLREVASLPPKRVRTGPVQHTVLTGAAVDLTQLPVLTTWPKDGGPFITLPLVISRDPVRGDVNVGMYRMQVYDRTTTAMHWQRHKTGARHLESARQAGVR